MSNAFGAFAVGGRDTTQGGATSSATPAGAAGGNNTLMYVSIGLGAIALLAVLLKK